ncbi:MAG: DUF5005 domain-containing protein [Candidatus Nanopelagicales bacterium]
MLHKVAVATASLLAGAGLLTAPAAAHVLAQGGTVAPPSPVVSSPRCGSEPTTGAGWERLFDGLRGGWSGGDGAASVRLPDGRLLWLFGDTFTGSVRADGRRSTDTTIVRNSMVVTDRACATVVAPGREALANGADGSWLWPTAGAVTAGGEPSEQAVVTVFAQRLVRDSHDAFGFRRSGTAVVTVTVPWRGLPVVGVPVDLPTSDVLWGAALVREGATTWVYGTRPVGEALVFGRDLLLARSPTTSLQDPATWTYRTADGWSARRTDAAVVRSGRQGVSTVPSAAVVSGAYVVVTKAQEFLDPTVLELRAPHPWGPWTETPLLTAATSTSVLRYSPAVVAGATRAHAIVVVSRTSLSLDALMSDAEVARPTFHDVRLG